MHISEGVLSAPVLLSGAAIAVVGTAIGLKKIDYDRMAQVGLMAATFFVASLVHVPIGLSSVHLILNGLVGLLLGWAAVPAILVALVLQAVFFQFGGITTLGVNTVIMASPAVITYYLFGRFIKKNSLSLWAASFGCGTLAVFLGAFFMALALVTTEENFIPIAKLAIVAHLPVMLIEGVITAFCVSFVKKVQPALLSNGY
jgi:cobalt/nickel transport system permease protein